MLVRILAALSLGLASMSALADEHAHSQTAQALSAQHAGSIQVMQPWSRAMPPTVPNGAAYFVLNNDSDRPDRLLGASSPQAKTLELHTHVHKDGLMSMQQVPFVEIPAKGQIAFKPGSYHVMLFGLTRPLVAGEHFPLTLELERAGQVTVEVSVLEEAPSHDMSGHEQPMHH